MTEHTPPIPQPKIPQVPADLIALGGESDTERTVKRIVPWVASLALHGGLLILGVIVTWAVVRSHDEEEPVLIVADFDSMQYAPVAKSSQQESLTRENVVPDRVASLDVTKQLTSSSSANASGATPAVPGAGSGAAADFAPAPPQGSATFVGISSSNARRIVYVIDASGSMISSFQIILEELSRSLDALTPQQQFQVVFFQKNEAIAARKLERLSPATPQEKLATLQWINDRSNIIPQGRSNPLAAIDKAMKLKPDVIFLLSENITGSGVFEIDQADLLALLDKLNPVEPETGKRAVQINCVQFLDPDPLDTLKKIAEIHGGPRGYKYLDRRQLGIASQ